MYMPTAEDYNHLHEAGGFGNMNLGIPMPAFIVNDWPGNPVYQESGTVNLKAMVDGDGILWAKSIPYSDQKEQGTWHWPEIK